MTLALTKEQKKYLDNKGPIKSKSLQRVFKKSVEEQQRTRKKAAKIRSKRSTSP